MRRGRTGVLRAAAVALAVAFAGAGPAAVAASGGPYALWVPGGSEVTGTASAAHAPLLTPGSTYHDSLAKGQTKYYAVRLAAIPDASGTSGAAAAATPDVGTVTSYLSAFAVPRPGTRVGFLDGISLSLKAHDGTLCDYYDARFAGAGATAPVGGVVRRPGTSDEVCREAGRYLLSVERESAASSGDEVWPLDLRSMAEPALAAAPAAGPVPTYDPVTAPPGTSEPVPVVGGAGMDGDGVRLTGRGAYRDHFAPGQTRYYRVPVDWGQRLSATADFANATTTENGQLTAAGLRLAVYSPARGYVDGESASYTGQAASIDAQTPAVAYDNRLSHDSRVNAAAVAGWYYVEVSLHPDVARYTSGGVDVTLRLQVSGTARPGPHYRGSALAAGFGVGGPAPRTVAPAGSPAGGALGGSVRRSVAYGAFTLAAVFFVWPTVWLLRGSRGGGAHGR